jgi:hypothetical protein
VSLPPGRGGGAHANVELLRRQGTARTASSVTPSATPAAAGRVARPRQREAKQAALGPLGGIQPCDALALTATAICVITRRPACRLRVGRVQGWWHRGVEPQCVEILHRHETPAAHHTNRHRRWGGGGGGARGGGGRPPPPPPPPAPTARSPVHATRQVGATQVPAARVRVPRGRHARQVSVRRRLARPRVVQREASPRCAQAHRRRRQVGRGEGGGGDGLERPTRSVRHVHSAHQRQARLTWRHRWRRARSEHCGGLNDPRACAGDELVSGAAVRLDRAPAGWREHVQHKRRHRSLRESRRKLAIRCVCARAEGSAAIIGDRGTRQRC